MTSAWLTTEDSPDVAQAADGDVVGSVRGPELRLGRVAAGAVEWWPETVPVSTLPTDALAGEAGSGLHRLPDGEPLLNAARGVETALRERGG
jgi:hypothetical protein